MTTVINQVTNTNYINNAEFVRIVVDGTAYAFSSSYQTETFDGTPFVGTATAMGGLISVSGHQRDLQVTSYDTTITLVGVDKTRIGQVIDAGLKGSKIEIWRGFYDSNYLLDGSPVLRYTGIITSYDIVEDVSDHLDTFALNVHCSSYKRILENRIAGRYTNSASWKNFDSTDIAMDNVAALNNAKYNFGQKLA
jgi:hypothetical protein